MTNRSVTIWNRFHSMTYSLKIKRKKLQTPNLSPLQKEIMAFIQAGETSALQICEKLIESGKLTKERFSTNKPKAYGRVCSILELLVSQGILVFVEDKDKKDRLYR